MISCVFESKRPPRKRWTTASTLVTTQKRKPSICPALTVFVTISPGGENGFRSTIWTFYRVKSTRRTECFTEVRPAAAWTLFPFQASLEINGRSCKLLLSSWGGFVVTKAVVALSFAQFSDSFRIPFLRVSPQKGCSKNNAPTLHPRSRENPKSKKGSEK